MTDLTTTTESTAATATPASDLGLAEGWRIEDLRTLEWALSRLAEDQAELAELDALRLEAIARVEARCQEIARRTKARGAYLEAKALEYVAGHREELLRGGKKKSRDLPAGTVGFRKSGGRLRVVDEAAALAWAKAQPVEEELVRVRVELSKTALQERFKKFGELPPGCDVEPEIETPYIKVEPPALHLLNPSTVTE